MSRDVIVYEKLPEHEDDPFITFTPSQGVSPDIGASSEAFTKAPIIDTNQSSPSSAPLPTTESVVTPKPTVPPTPPVETHIIPSSPL